MGNYKISAANCSQCHQCEKPYSDGERCFFTLREEEEEFVKLSFCEKCWQEVENKEDLLCYWKGRREIKEAKKPQFDREFALNLFYSLEDSSQVRKQKIRYLLGLVLTRKKMLRWEKMVRKEGREWLILRKPRKRGGGEIKLPVPDFDLEEIEALKEELIYSLTEPVESPAKREEETPPLNS